MLIRDIMSKNLVTIAPETSLRGAANKMEEHNIGVLPVFDGKKLFGIVTDRDLVVRGIAKGFDSDKTPIEEVMTQKCFTCSESEDVESAIDLMEQENVRRMVVTRSGNGHEPIGIFSLDDIARKSKDLNLSGRAFLQLNKKSRKVP